MIIPRMRCSRIDDSTIEQTLLIVLNNANNISYLLIPQQIY